MWLFTKYGFYSVSAVKKGRAFMVRSRQRAHMVNLQDRFPELADKPIRELKNRDYQYRIFVSKPTWVRCVAAMTEEQTWSNFKDEAGRFEKAHNQAHTYVDALHDIWLLMLHTTKRWRGKTIDDLPLADLPPTDPFKDDAVWGNIKKQIDEMHEEKKG